MIPYFVGILALGIFIGRCWVHYQIIKAAKHNKVIAIDGNLYIAQKIDSKRDPGGVR